MSAPIAGGSFELTMSGMCSVCAEMLSAQGVAIMLLASDQRPVATYSSSPSFDEMEDLQFTLGVGPAPDAFRRGEPVTESDLVGRPPLQWPDFAGRAHQAHVRSAFSFPLQAGDSRLGAITIYRAVSGRLDLDGHTDAVAMAGVVTRSILDLRAGCSADDFAAGLLHGRVDVAGVHQASGVVSAQLHIGVGEALARIRAHAFSTGTTIQHVAHQVIGRRLRLSM